MEKTLHYIYDPLCGWCYAAEALVETSSQIASGHFNIQLHAGGLFSRTHLPDAMRAHIRAADSHIGDLTGQIFSDQYLNGLLGDPGTIYDSIPPIRAILAAEQAMPGSALKMLKRLQHAHYREGRRIVEQATMTQAAEWVGIDRHQYERSYEAVTESDTARHVNDTHSLMHLAGARGYPSFVVRVGKDLYRLDHDRFYGNPEGFAAFVSEKFGYPLA